MSPVEGGRGQVGRWWIGDGEGGGGYCSTVSCDGGLLQTGTTEKVSAATGSVSGIAQRVIDCLVVRLIRWLVDWLLK